MSVIGSPLFIGASNSVTPTPPEPSEDTDILNDHCIIRIKTSADADSLIISDQSSSPARNIDFYPDEEGKDLYFAIVPENSSNIVISAVYHDYVYGSFYRTKEIDIGSASDQLFYDVDVSSDNLSRSWVRRSGIKAPNENAYTRTQEGLKDNSILQLKFLPELESGIGCIFGIYAQRYIESDFKDCFINLMYDADNSALTFKYGIGDDYASIAYAIENELDEPLDIEICYSPGFQYMKVNGEIAGFDHFSGTFSSVFGSSGSQNIFIFGYGLYSGGFDPYYVDSDYRCPGILYNFSASSPAESSNPYFTLDPAYRVNYGRAELVNNNNYGLTSLGTTSFEAVD